jgi:hypothetical protein
MKIIYILTTTLSAAILTGCGLATVKMYEGEVLRSSEHAVLSGIGVYRENKLVMNVIAIDGKVVDRERTAEFLLKPGKYLISLAIDKDRIVTTSAGMVHTSAKKATTEVSLNAVAGHTYIPNALTDGEKVVAYFDDAGIGFNKECMPARRFATAYGGNYDGKRAGC